MANIILNGKAVSPSAITRMIGQATKSSERYNELLTAIVSSALAHAGLHSNLSPLIEVLGTLKTKAGALNKQGRTVRDYILDHYKAIDITADGAVSFKKVTVKVEGGDAKETKQQTISPARRNSYLTGEIKDNGRPETKAFDDATGYYGITAYGVWLSTDYAKVEKPEADKNTVTPNQIRRRLESITKMVSGKQYKGTADDWNNLLSEVSALSTALLQMTPITDIDASEAAINPPSMGVPGGSPNTPIGGKKNPKIHAKANRKVAA